MSEKTQMEVPVERDPVSLVSQHRGFSFRKHGSASLQFQFLPPLPSSSCGWSRDLPFTRRESISLWTAKHRQPPSLAPLPLGPLRLKLQLESPQPQNELLLIKIPLEIMWLTPWTSVKKPVSLSFPFTPSPLSSLTPVLLPSCFMSALDLQDPTLK